jgi:hypothetical protein
VYHKMYNLNINSYHRMSSSFFRDLSLCLLWLCPHGWVSTRRQHTGTNPWKWGWYSATDACVQSVHFMIHLHTYNPHYTFLSLVYNFNTRLLGAFAKLGIVTTSFVMSVCLSVRSHGTTRLPLDGFSWNLIFEDFSKIWRQNSIFVKIWRK